MMPDIQTFLKTLGLSPKESKLYLAALRYGPQTASVLAKKTGSPRSTVNFLFNRLIKKGFASKDTQQKTTYFQVISPDLIEYVLLKKHAKVKKQLQEYKDLLPALNTINNPLSPVPKVQYYEGLEGIYRTIDYCCDTDETIYYISGHNNMHPKVRDYCESIYIPKASKHLNKNKMILNDGPLAQDYVKKASEVYDEIIFIDPKENPLTLTTAIKGNKTTFMSYDSDDMSGIIIENQLIANHMKTIYKILKKHFKPTS